MSQLKRLTSHRRLLIFNKSLSLTHYFISKFHPHVISISPHTHTHTNMYGSFAYKDNSHTPPTHPSFQAIVSLDLSFLKKFFVCFVSVSLRPVDLAALYTSSTKTATFILFYFLFLFFSHTFFFFLYASYLSIRNTNTKQKAIV